MKGENSLNGNGEYRGIPYFNISLKGTNGCKETWEVHVYCNVHPGFTCQTDVIFAIIKMEVLY